MVAGGVKKRKRKRWWSLIPSHTHAENGACNVFHTGPTNFFLRGIFWWAFTWALLAFCIAKPKIFVYNIVYFVFLNKMLRMID